MPAPGGHLVIDWTPAGGLQMFGAVLAWCRYRFVRFADDQRRATTLRLICECLEEIGGVPGVVLSDRMAGLRANQVAGLVVPHPDYLRLAAHYGFAPDFCWAADPESKGMVEHLMGYAQADLVVPAGQFGSVEQATCWPSQKAMAAARQRVRDLTPLHRVGLPAIMAVQDLNRFLQGWGAYFRHGNSTQQFTALDGYVFWRLSRFMTRKYGKRGYRRGMADLLGSKTQLGLYRLAGTIDYASAHAAR